MIPSTPTVSLFLLSGIFDPPDSLWIALLTQLNLFVRDFFPIDSRVEGSFIFDSSSFIYSIGMFYCSFGLLGYSWEKKL